MKTHFYGKNPALTDLDWYTQIQHHALLILKNTGTAMACLKLHSALGEKVYLK